VTKEEKALQELNRRMDELQRKIDILKQKQIEYLERKLAR
jgi:hypothetical protein